MEKIKGASYDSYSTAIRLCCALWQELDFHKKSRDYLTIDEYKTLKGYYPTLSSENIESFAQGEARTLKHVIHHIRSYPFSPKILDAGCGFGSHAIFFGLLGAEVIGVDLHKERLDIAKKRVRYYYEKYGKMIDVRFMLRNILSFCGETKFDMAWSNQSISHIHPVQEFLRMAHKNLKYGGYLLVCDSNGLNPVVTFRAMLVHSKGGLYTTAKDPDTGEQILYARERMLNPLSLSNLLKEANFDVQLKAYSGFVPSRFGTRKPVNFLDEILANLPFVHLIGASFLISARKNASTKT